jgi:ABC-2 type transport system ATP-binding protein
VIEAVDLVKTYEQLRAVDGLSFRVEAGDILGLVGPNGAGKTTALRCITGIVPPASGRVLIDGFDLREQPIEAKRRLAFVPDEPKLFEHLTAWDHVVVMARIHGVADGAERGRDLLGDMGLAEKLDAFPSELSRGMRQKLMITLALLHRPRALILDEPLTGLDPAAMKRMRERIVSVAHEGVAVILSSHMLSLVETLCSRVLIMAKGRKVLEGTLAEIRAGLPELEPNADLESIFLHATGADETA